MLIVFYFIYMYRFHLAEAMSAIELMDPKMDVGMVKMERTVGFDESVKVCYVRVKIDVEEYCRAVDYVSIQCQPMN